jgi:acyl-[acyl-carrier-protein]-phospholipid O-acyltransferase / long-chain-fatty-acid--[acyl-carrier-protein] ligase
MNSVAMAIAYGLLDVMHDLLHWSPRTIFAALGVASLIGAVIVARLMPAIVLRFVLSVTANLLFKIEITGAENIPKSGAALLVSNHISYADAVLAGYGTRRFVRFLMWKPIYEVRFARPVFEILKAIPVDSASPKIAVRALRTAHEELLHGKLVGIFPEGQITRTGETGPFERGYELVVRGLDCPIVPMYISGLWGHPLSCKGGEPFKSWDFWFRPRVTVRIGQPVSNNKTPDELRQIVMEVGGHAASAASLPNTA